MKILKSIWKTWKRIGQAIGDFIARIVLTVFYFTLFAPFAIGIRLFGDPLMIKKEKHLSSWLERTTQDIVIDNARRQF